MENGITEYFEDVETIKEYSKYFYSVAGGGYNNSNTGKPVQVRERRADGNADRVGGGQ